MTPNRPVRELISYAIGGGWGLDGPEEGLVPVAVIRGADFPAIASGDVSSLPLRHETPKRAQGRYLMTGDIVLEVSGGTKNRPTGRVVRVSERVSRAARAPLIPASFCRLIRPNSELIDDGYLYYWLLDMYSQGRTWAYQVQSTGLANFQFEHLLDAELASLPPLDEQRRIAGVLGAFDDLIAVNRQLIDHLGAMQSAVFADLDSDDLQSAEPEVAIGEVLQVFGGSTPSTKVPEYWDGGEINWATPKDLSRLSSTPLLRTERRITPSGLARISSGLLPAGTLLMSSRAPVGYLAIAEIPTAINQGFIAIKGSDELPPLYLLEWLRAHIGDVMGLANGSTFQEISKRNFRTLRIRVPKQHELSKFMSVAVPCHRSIVALEEECDEMARTRDALLPLLMSGQVRVREVTA